MLRARIPMSNISFIQLAKLYWIRETEGGIFPRMMGEKRYYPMATDLGSYYKYIGEQIKTKQDAFIAFYSNYDIETRIVNQLFLDVDRKDNWESMKLFLVTFWNNIDVFFSGSKGIHVRVYINPTNQLPFNNQSDPNYLRLRRVFSTWLQTNVDSQTFLDIKRMYRIAFTRHRNEPHKWKIPISPEWSMDEIEEKASNPEKYVNEFVELYKKPICPIDDWKLFLRNPKNVLSGN